MTKKQEKSKKVEKGPINIVEEKKKAQKSEPKQDTAEDRAKRELERTIAYQARLAKRRNRPQKIRTVAEDHGSNRDGNKKGITRVTLQCNFETIVVL